MSVEPIAAESSVPAIAPAAPRRRRWWPTLLWLAAIGAAGVAVVRDPTLVERGWERGLAVLRPPAAAAKPQPPRVVPVTAVEARKADVDLFLNGLGSVVAFNTVTVRSRVEGELVKVAFQEGQSVEAGDLLAEIDPRPFEVQLRQAEGQLARDQAALTAAQLDLERYESLANLKQVTAQQIDAQRALVRQCEAATQIDRGLIDNVRLQLDFCRITAPISGRIGLRLVDSGNIVRANDPAGLAVIAQLHPIAVVFTIPQDEIIRVQRALAGSGRLPVEAFNRDFRTKLATGSLLAIDNQVDSSTGTVRLKAVFPNEDNTLFPNQFVNARLLVETLPGATVVPAVAVQHGPDSNFVYVVQPDSTVALRTVEPGPAQGDVVTIAAGLKPGDLVVTDGIDKIANKARVVVRGPGAGGSGAAAVATGPAPGGPATAARP
jgi:multidrug efflux system membrane fusion protein